MICVDIGRYVVYVVVLILYVQILEALEGM